MNWVKTTRAVMIVTVIALLLYDCIAAKFGGQVATISDQTFVLSHHWLEIPFGAGLLMGHLFARIEGVSDKSQS